MNNITTIDGHILLPHQADWNTRPDLTRMWQGSVDSALSGAEDRSSVRPVAWMRFAYSVLAYNHVERGRFDDRMRAALKAGKMAVPFWGRGVPIAYEADVGHEQLILTRSNHRFEAGKHAIIQSSSPPDFDTFDAVVIDSVEGEILHLSAALANHYPRGTYVWPLLFGKPIPDQFQVHNSSRNRYSVSIQFDGRQINAISEDDFESYDLGSVSDADGGEGWAGPWVFGAYAA